MIVQLFKRWRRSRSDEQIESIPPSTSSVPPTASAVISSPRSRRPATMGRTEAEQAYLAQAAIRAKQS
jgi:hypothetical protein